MKTLKLSHHNLPHNLSLTRRSFLGAGLLCASSTTAYGFGIEPGFLLRQTTYNLTPKNWPKNFSLTLAVIADLHIAEPYVSAARVAHIVALTNAQKPDVIVLLGDFVCTHPFVSGYVAPEVWADTLAKLQAPLGTYAILGNHDWWSAALPQNPPDGSTSIRRALARAAIPLLENNAVRLVKRLSGQKDQPFWLLGLGDQLAHLVHHRTVSQLGWEPATDHLSVKGVDDLPATLAKLNDDAPAILLAHEPFIFNKVPERVALTLSGHTHGGQVNLPLIGVPWTPHASRTPYLYGHYEVEDRHLIVSGGIGTSIVPLRLGVPPEIVFVTLGAPAPNTAGA